MSETYNGNFKLTEEQIKGVKAEYNHSNNNDYRVGIINALIGMRVDSKDIFKITTQ